VPIILVVVIRQPAETCFKVICLSVC